LRRLSGTSFSLPEADPFGLCGHWAFLPSCIDSIFPFPWCNSRGRSGRRFGVRLYPNLSAFTFRTPFFPSFSREDGPPPFYCLFSSFPNLGISFFLGQFRRHRPLGLFGRGGFFLFSMLTSVFFLLRDQTESPPLSIR